MQLAALDTSTKCLIVTKQKPSTAVMVKAEDKKVPVMVVNKDIIDIVAGLSRRLAAARFHHMLKSCSAMTAMLGQPASILKP